MIVIMKFGLCITVLYAVEGRIFQLYARGYKIKDLRGRLSVSRAVVPIHKGGKND